MRKLWLDLYLIDKTDLSKLSVVELLELTIPFLDRPFEPVEFTIPPEDNTMSLFLKWFKEEEYYRINYKIRYSMYIEMISEVLDEIEPYQNKLSELSFLIIGYFKNKKKYILLKENILNEYRRRGIIIKTVFTKEEYSFMHDVPAIVKVNEDTITDIFWTDELIVNYIIDEKPFKLTIKLNKNK